MIICREKNTISILLTFVPKNSVVGVVFDEDFGFRPNSFFLITPRRSGKAWINFG
jgi:hypothetical protein